MTATHPLRRLRVFAAPYRARIRRGVAFSVLNKFFDVLPEILIGVAVDVVVNQRDSFLSRVGIADPMQQLWFLVGLTVLVWVCESLFEYLHALTWRRTCNMTCARRPTRMCRNCRRISSDANAPAG